MVCAKCTNWKCKELTYDELATRWVHSIGGIVTPGIFNRYKKAAAKKGQNISEIRIGFKYCAAGILTRFYIRRGEADCKPMRKMEGCPQFTEGNFPVESSSRLWHLCTTESHGPSEVNGIPFTPGLYENNTYMRIPCYDSVRPLVEKGDSVCSMCGKESGKSIRIRIEKSFCCNKHYLEWWSKMHLEDCQKLNR